MKVPSTNIIENVIQTRLLITKTYLENMQCVPRPAPKRVPVRKRPKTPWDISKSVFKDYVVDTPVRICEACKGLIGCVFLLCILGAAGLVFRHGRFLFEDGKNL